MIELASHYLSLCERIHIPSIDYYVNSKISSNTPLTSESSLSASMSYEAPYSDDNLSNFGASLNSANGDEDDYEEDNKINLIDFNSNFLQSNDLFNSGYYLK